MVPLQEHYGPGRFGLSFEFFPPKTQAAEEHLMGHVDELMNFRPDYITCTYGAGGSTRGKTLDTLDRIRMAGSIPCASHFTCVGSTVEDIRDYLNQARDRKVDYIVALRGDPPKGETKFTRTEGGLGYANELVEFIKAEYPDFGIAVAGYPEVHQEAESPEADMDSLKRKVDAGADVIITQLFFQNEDYYRWRDKCELAGIDVPIVPGVLPVTNVGQVKRVAAMCGAHFPEEFVRMLDEHADDPVSQFAEGVYYSMCQVEDLLKNGVPGIHFYVLNRSHATSLICKGLRLPYHAG